MASPSEDRQSVKRENRSAEIRPSEELTNSDTTTTTEVDTENEHQDVTTLPSPRPRKRTAEHIGGRLIKRRRVGRSDITTNTQTPARAVTPPLPSSSAAETSSQTEQSSESEATIPESHDSAPHLTFTATNLLEWKDIPYPGFPQIGYAFSYASGPIRFVKVGPLESRSLIVHRRPTHNYVAYVFYTPDQYTDTKLLGLEMLNELAARGFIDDDTCHLHEEMVGSDRALIFSKSGVVVGLPKLGAPRGYLPHSAVDQEDRQQILYKLQTAMHDRAIPEQPAPVTTSSPASRKSSSVSKRWSTATLTSSDHEDAASTSGPQNASLENCGLIKFVKVHWKQSKNIRDNLHAINPNQDAYPMNPANPEGSLKVETFKAVIVWANKKDKKEGIKLLEKMIVERLGKPVQEVRKSKYLKEAEEVVEVADDGARWLAFHKENVVVGFPGSRGDEAFIEAVQAMDTVWN